VNALAAEERAGPLVSIVVLCHNYGRFLPEALESALAQTHSKCEVVLADDGSTDDSVEIASRYASVRVVSNPHRGVERTCNDVIPKVAGEYFVLLDADDSLAPTYVEELLAALRRNPDAAYAYCRPLMFGARTGSMRCLPFSAYFLIRRTNFVNKAALTRKQDFVAVGGYSEDLGEHAFEDWDFFLRMLAAGKRGTYVREPLLRWRRHDDGSRNPELGERVGRSTAFIRERHSEALERIDDRRGRLYYTIDLAAAAVDLLIGYSRFPRLLRAVEVRSWRRYQRRHAAARVGSE
jgi:glycosyltransferase involved in cell wall biosynthesis